MAEFFTRADRFDTCRADKLAVHNGTQLDRVLAVSRLLQETRLFVHGHLGFVRIGQQIVRFGMRLQKAPAHLGSISGFRMTDNAAFSIFGGNGLIIFYFILLWACIRQNFNDFYTIFVFALTEYLCRW